MDNSPKSKFKTITIIHWAILAPMIMFGAFSYYKNLELPSGEMKGTDTIVYIPVILMFVAIYAGRFLYNNTLKQAEGKPFNDRLMTFTTATIIRDAIFEMAGIAAGVAAFVSGNNTILLLLPIIVLQFWINRPTHLKVETDLRATREEMSELN